VNALISRHLVGERRTTVTHEKSLLEKSSPLISSMISVSLEWNIDTEVQTHILTSLATEGFAKVPRECLPNKAFIRTLSEVVSTYYALESIFSEN
jgi:hypothetical protein